MGQFCEKAKAEILAVPLRSRKAKIAFLSAVFSSLGSLTLKSGQAGYVLRMPSAAFQETVCRLTDELYRNGADFFEERSRVTVSGGFFERITADLRLFGKDGDGALVYAGGIHPDLVRDAECRKAYLRGLFLSLGSVTIAKGYHLELGFFNGFLAADCVNVLKDSGFQFSVVSHKEKTVAYIKDNETVGDFLAFLGASGAVLDLCDVFAKRACDKLTNRRINCDLANIDKTVAMSSLQIETIQTLKNNGEFKRLPLKLQQTADLRLKYPEASLADLAQLAGITKSGMRHRLSKIMQRTNITAGYQENHE